MSVVKVIVFRVTTPDEGRDFKRLAPALEWLEDQLLANGWLDGYRACIEQVEVEAELPDDTEWLERRLGRKEESDE